MAHHTASESSDLQHPSSLGCLEMLKTLWPFPCLRKEHAQQAPVLFARVIHADVFGLDHGRAHHGVCTLVYTLLMLATTLHQQNEWKGHVQATRVAQSCMLRMVCALVTLTTLIPCL